MVVIIIIIIIIIIVIIIIIIIINIIIYKRVQNPTLYYFERKRIIVWGDIVWGGRGVNNTP